MELNEPYRRLWPETDADEWAIFAVTGGRAPNLLPVGHRRALAEALVRHHAAMDTKERLVRNAAWAAARLGLLTPVLRKRISVPRSYGDGPSLHEELEHLLGVAPLELAVAFGPPRPNQKPVVRAIDRRGRTVAFAKVGWNDLTARLVEQEASTLSRPAMRSLRHVMVPEVIAVEEWAGFRLAVYAPLLGRPGRSAPTWQAFHEVARLWPTTRQPLADAPVTAWLRVWPVSEEAEKAAEVLSEALDRWGDVEVEVGGWHGDWTPWNTARHSHDRWIVWDWERSEGGVPTLFDLIHYRFQPRAVRSEYPAEELIEDLSTQTPLGRDLSPTALSAVVAWYLLAISRRHAGHAGLSQLGQVRRLLESRVGARS